MARASKTKGLMATAMIEDLTRLVEQYGDLPVMTGLGHTPRTPSRPKVMAAVREEHIKTMFICHRPLLSDLYTTPIIRFS